MNLCEICEQRPMTDEQNGTCAECHAEVVASRVTHYRFVHGRDPIGRILFNVETRRGSSNWQYSQTVGNEIARDSFARWAEKSGWIQE